MPPSPEKFGSTLFATEMEGPTEFSLFLGDTRHTVRTGDVSPETSLNTYLREKMFLTGTKYMCNEGGCGTCIVAVTAKHPVSKADVTFAVNSCLVSILSCSGWKISTNEGIGNELIGIHPIQQKLADFNGSQCGFCSSGMVMNMYALYQQGKLTMEEVENSFGGNMCRCTGYRPILAAFKSMAVDASKHLLGTYPDIEEVRRCAKDTCKQTCPIPCSNTESLFFDYGDSKWYKVHAIEEIFNILRKNAKKNYKLVAGNTAKGVYRDFSTADIYIDVANVPELQQYKLSSKELVIGANTTLTDAMKLFQLTSEKDENFAYLSKLRDHIDLVAHVPVRNVGTLAGNLSIKYKHNEFPSDIFLLLESVNAFLTIVDETKQEVRLKPKDYLGYKMDRKVIKSISLPALNASYKFESYKIMPRAQNAHAMVNAAFLFKLSKSNSVESANIVYGGINPKFIHATKAESYVIGKKLFDNSTLQDVFRALDEELKPDYVLPDPTPKFRKQLAIALFYKFVLSIAPKVTDRNKSGGQKLVRPISYGTQEYDTQKSMYPLSEPISKLEAKAQTMGRATYIVDIPDRPNQLYAAFVLAKAPAYSKIVSIDAKPALAMKGVVAFLDKNDIPGVNSFTPPQTSYSENEEIFCSGTVAYYHQPIGIVVANDKDLADAAAEKVVIVYSKSNKQPLLTIRDVLAKDKSKLHHIQTVTPKSKGNNITHVVKGEFDISWQYHYHMETQCCNVVPIEDGFDIHPSSQWMDLIQVAGAVCLGIDVNKINVSVRRCGGAYGGKISRNNLISCAGLIAAKKLDKPVKIHMTFESNMDAIGKRNPCSTNYEVGTNDKGVIQYMNMSYYSDMGQHGINELPTDLAIRLLTDTYNSDTYDIEVYYTVTDTVSTTWTRGPGSTEAVAAIESLMEHTAYSLNIDPLELRLANVNEAKYPKVKQYMTELSTWADVKNRRSEIEAFNKQNRWRKRGLSIVPMAYALMFQGNFTVMISIYQGDGTVSIAHGGIEIGQGINTKAAQTVAFYLGIPVDKIAVKPSSSLISPNSYVTGGSQTSEAICMALIQVCDTLNKRIDPIRQKMPSDAKWEDIIKRCFTEGVDLSNTYMWLPNSEKMDYEIYGVAAVDVEVDFLTGLHIVGRVDLLEDTGTSMNPIIDIGQVEGAFIMGLGYYTTEQIILSPEGELKTNRTWNYKIPGAKDIPVDFRVRFPKNNPNIMSPLKSKATAEPPLALSVGVALALRNALKYIRADAQPKADSWVPINGPCTVEDTFLNALNDYKQYTL